MAVRAWLRLACVYLTLAVIAAPSALGAAMGPVLREVGATQEHVCKCGMPQGKCGCPECALLELERKGGQVPDAVSTLKRGCEDDGAPVPLTATAAAVLPPQVSIVPAGTSNERERLFPRAAPASPDLERSTPPPRSASI